MGIQIGAGTDDSSADELPGGRFGYPTDDLPTRRTIWSFRQIAYPKFTLYKLKLGTVRVKTENRTEPKLISVPVPVRVKEPKTEPNRRFNPKCI